MSNEINNLIKVTNDNYFSDEAERQYMTYSQFKGFMECEAQQLAKIEKRYEEPKSEALLQGSYLDAYFSKELDKFREENPELFKKDGTLLAKFAICETAIEAIKNDDTFYSMFFSGNPQTVLTGTIAGVPFKGKLDMLYEDKIVDMKFMKDVDSVWDEELRKKRRFMFYYKYHIQAAIYQELAYQKTGVRLPYYLAVATKTTPVEKHAYRFDQKVLDNALELVKEYAPRFQRIKNHEEEAKECGHCKYYNLTHEFEIFDIETVEEEE